MRTLVVVALALILHGVSIAQGTYFVDYYANNYAAGPTAFSQTIHIVNNGTQGTPMTSPVGDICANFFVFDSSQAMLSCCSCRITPNEVSTSYVGSQLTSNPLTTIVPASGVIKLVTTPAAGSCSPTAALVAPSADLATAWATHLHTNANATAYLTEIQIQPSLLSASEMNFLSMACQFVWYLGSGNGVCSCGVPPTPVANAGPNQTVTAGSTVVLNGANSASLGDSLTYSWTLVSRPAGSASSLTAANTVSPTFVPDKTGTYTAQLVVSENAQQSPPSIVNISAGLPAVPIANAGPNQTVTAGSTVVLNGSGSKANSGNPLTYSWSLPVMPAGSSAALSGPTTTSPTFVTDKSGTFVARLIVNDGFQDSAPATVTVVAALPPAPVANAGPDQTLAKHSTVVLNGSGSVSNSGRLLTYAWTLTSRPANSIATLTASDTVSPTFFADMFGTYIVQLVVNDAFQNSAASVVTINVVKP